MALLQSDKAIFYHPLDDSAESLKSQTWTLGSGSLAGAGKLSLALSSPDSGPTFGTGTDFLGASTNRPWVVTLSATVFVVMYNTTTLGKGRVGTVSGTDITFGAEATWYSSGGGAPNRTSASPLSSTTFILAHNEGSSSPGFSEGVAKVGTVSGTDLTFGAVKSFLTFNTSFARVAAVSSTAFVVVYQESGSSGQGRVGTVSGTDITFGSSTIFGYPSGAGWLSITPLSTTKVAIAYQVTSGSAGKSVIGTVTGSSIAFGTEAEFNSGSSAKMSAAALSATAFVVTYQDAGDSSHGTAKVGTVSGTSITFGPEAEFLSAGTANDISAYAFSSTKFVVVYRDDADSNHGTAKIGTVSGTAITFGPESEFHSSSAASENTVTTLSATKFVVAWQVGGTGAGAAKVGTLAVSGASLAHVPEAPSLGTENEYLTDTVQPLVSIAKLSATKFVACYSDATTGLAKIGTVSGTDITYGAESIFEPASSGTMDPIDVAGLSSTAIAIVYQVNSPAARYVKAGTVSGTDVTWGTGVSYFASASSRDAIAALDSTKFVVAYRRDSTTSWAARVGTVSGADVTLGGQKVGTGSGNNDAFDIVALNSTKFVALWHNDLSGGNYWGKVGTVSGTDITFGTAVAFSASTGSGTAYIAGDALSSTSVLVAYRDGGDSQHGTAKIATVSGANITYGAETEFLAADATNIGVAALSSTLAAVTYRKETGGDCAAKFATVSGTDITFGDEGVFASGNSGGDVTNKAAAMDSGTFVVSYRDNADSDHGTAKVGSTDPYDSVIASTKIAFAGWMKNPSA